MKTITAHVTKPVLYAVDDKLLNQNICEQFEKDFGNLSITKQKDEKEWIVENLYQIDNGLFDSQKYVYHPIRFHFNEYRHILFTRFNGI